MCVCVCVCVCVCIYIYIVAVVLWLEELRIEEKMSRATTRHVKHERNTLRVRHTQMLRALVCGLNLCCVRGGGMRVRVLACAFVCV